jgi:hypothetical protein
VDTGYTERVSIYCRRRIAVSFRSGSKCRWSKVTPNQGHLQHGGHASHIVHLHDQHLGLILEMLPADNLLILQAQLVVKEGFCCAKAAPASIYIVFM